MYKIAPPYLKRGPPTILLDAEELKLAEWAMEMASIGYGRTRVQVSEMVKRLLDEDGRLWITTLAMTGGMGSLDVILKFHYAHLNSCNFLVHPHAAKKD